MRQISSLLQGLARSLSVGRDRKGDGRAGDGNGKAAVPAVLRTSGTLWGEASETFAAVCSRRGEKGINQDCSIVWEVSNLSFSFSFSLQLGSCCVLCFLLPIISFFFYWNFRWQHEVVTARDISVEFYKIWKIFVELMRSTPYILYKKPNKQLLAVLNKH